MTYMYPPPAPHPRFANSQHSVSTTMHTPTTAFLFMISTVTALPPPVMHNRPLAEHVNRGAQSCIGTQKQFDQLFYESRIGQVYAKSKCEELEDRLDHAGVLATDVRCVKDEDGFTFVSFVSYWNYGAIFNGVLGSVFTEINGFNCPSH